MMWRNGPKLRRNGDNGKADNNVGPTQLVAVAVDTDKNSQHALRWASDHIISRGQIFLLIHVRKRIGSLPTQSGHEVPISEVEDNIVATLQEQMDRQTKELLLPFQCFCNRRGLNCKEVILEDLNVSDSIVNYVQQHGVEKLVLGASSRNAFTRTFKNVDVPTTVCKNAPEFCSVYVISKGKITSSRPATAPKTNSHAETTAAAEINAGGTQFQSTKSETVVRTNTVEAPRRYAMMNSARSGLSNNMVPKISDQFSGVGHEGAHHDFSYQSMASCPSPSRMSTDNQMLSYIPKAFRNAVNQQNYSSASSASSASSSSEHDYLNDRGDDYEFSRPGGGYLSSFNRSSERLPPQKERGAFSGHSAEDMDSELRRLKLELKYAEDKYGVACETTADVGSVFEEPRYSREKMFGKEKQGFTQPSSLSSPEAYSDTGSQSNSQVEMGKVIGGEKITLLPLMEQFSSDCRYRRYSIEEIQLATNNFSDELRIGEGGYGPVFKCSLDHTVVAVKIPRTDVAQGMKQFQQEVEVLSCIRHPNMVLLMGACPEYGCLVYEYMGNGSLEDRLFCHHGTPPLTWQLRFMIAAEIATGLLFLHQTKPEPIVHRDLKPANILLDNNFVSKITDVGLARLIPESTAAYSTRYVATVAAGTFCYIDPEYQKTGTVGVKSDTYALGIILLQMITARPPMGLTHVTENALEEGRLRDLLDPNVPDWPVDEVEGLAKLALSCAELRRKDRPDLATVVLPELNRLRDFALSAKSSNF